MEILIPGLILVALMVWASTKIKKRAADAFEAELIETDEYRLNKPEGFLHVIGDEKHELSAYSKDFGKNDNSGIRQATIELDVFRGGVLNQIRDDVVGGSTDARVTSQTGTACEIDSEEAANEIPIRTFYKIVAAGDAVYRLRFAALSEHVDDYLRKIKETLDSFVIK